MKSIVEALDNIRASSGVPTFEAKVYATEEERYAAKEEMANNTEGKLHLSDGFNCDKCRNKGFIYKYRKNEYGFYEMVSSICRCAKSRRSIRNLKNSGLEGVLEKYTFENFNAEEDWQKVILEKAKTYLSSGKGKWFFVGGQSGSGKSHICSAICIELLRRGKELKYMLWRDEVRKIKSDNLEGGELIEKYKEVEVLYIDDLFKNGIVNGYEHQMPTQADINIAFEILNAREHRGKITIISSESTIYELFDIDEATAGRIKEKCDCFVTNISRSEGKNYRKRETI